MTTTVSAMKSIKTGPYKEIMASLAELINHPKEGQRPLSSYQKEVFDVMCKADVGVLTSEERGDLVRAFVWMGSAKQGHFLVGSDDAPLNDLLDQHQLFGVSKPYGSTAMFAKAEEVVSDININIFWNDIYDKLNGGLGNTQTP